MRHFLDALKNVTTIAKSFGRKTTTVQFPKELRPRAERYRASFALLHEADGDEACIGCLQCERICPSKVISIKGPAKKDSPITGKKRSYADDFTLDLSDTVTYVVAYAEFENIIEIDRNPQRGFRLQQLDEYERT